MNEIQIATMTEREAQEWERRIGKSVSSLRILLAEGYERQVWVALGFDNWSQCLRSIAKKHELKERYVWYLHQANETEKLLHRGAVGEIPERQLRPLTTLDPADQIKVWQEVLDVKPDGKVTAKFVEKFVDEFKKSQITEIEYPEVPDSELATLYNLPAAETPLEPESVDLIITDPPYPGEFLYCWTDLANLAERVLKPSGFLFAYSGQMYLPQVISALSSKLIYYWTISLVHSGGNQLVFGRNVFCGWKPIFVFQKPPFTLSPDQFPDTLKGSGKEKDLHEWQQAESELDDLILRFSTPGQTILDPFMGSGTTVAAAAKHNRRGIGVEIDKARFLVAKKRIHDALQNH